MGTEPLKVSVSVPQVAPGTEGTKCMQVRLTNATAVNITRLHNTLSAASHHFIVTALSDANAAEMPLTDCKPFRGALAGAPLAITQKHDDTVQLPDGIGYSLRANQVMHLELHYLNTTDKTLDVSGTAELIAAPADAKLEQGSVMLVGTRDIDIPAHSKKEGAVKYLTLPAGMEGVKFFAITGHTHRFGTSVKVGMAMGAMGKATELYAPAPFDWEAPEMKQLEPHVSLPAGGGFTLQCAWNNTSDAEIKFGESALAEMCFFWGYYYPKKDVPSVVLDNLSPDIIKR